MTEQHPPGRDHGADAPLRIGVVGAGPKAMFALEELTAHLARAAGEPGSSVTGSGTAGSSATDSGTAGPDHGPPALEVTLIDPSPVLGSGAAYDLSQPHYLRLNVTASILDAPPTGSFPTYRDWVRDAFPELAEEPYPPRAVVGEYLAERFAQLVASLREHGTVHVMAGRALAVEHVAAGWTVEVEHAAPAGRRATARAGVSGPHPEAAEDRDGSITANASRPGGGERSALGPFDELLIATGHADGHPGALHHSWRSPTPLRPAVLPVQAMLSPEHVPAGSRVAVRGGALTFIDASLALTEGRGGIFTPTADGRRFIHHRGADEPAVIRPITRQGLLLDAKPDPGTALPPAAQRAVEHGRARFGVPGADPAGGATALSPDQVLRIVVDAAVEALAHADPAAPVGSLDSPGVALAGNVGPGGFPIPAGDRSAPDVRAAVEHTLATGAEPDLPRGPGRAVAALERSIDAVGGSRPGGPAWALGRMWSQLYPQITETLRGSDAPEQEWARFREAAQVLERFAFGPPLVNARKLLAMIESGAVDLAWLDDGVRIDSDGIHPPPMDSAADPGLITGPDLEADVVIDAVLTPPGLVDVTDQLSASLVEDGLVSVRPGRRGAMVDTDGTALTAANTAPAADGTASTVDGTALASRATRVEHLALVGRPTEDHVIGHDTLNRHLHHEGRNWAERVARRVTAGGRHASTAGALTAVSAFASAASSAFASTADMDGHSPSHNDPAATTEDHRP